MNTVKVKENECKGCEICISVCPKSALILSKKINLLGYNYVEFLEDKGCTACSLCFLNCPEFGALTVYKEVI
ncbi:MAG: 4Fe-4S dicluster domain-containing protein [Sphaerochaetaceae bacterium]